jgi:hypothetical protein
MERKMFSMFVVALLASSMSLAAYVDSFDSYATGDVDVVTGGVWVESPTATSTTMLIKTDPTNAGNQVLNVQNNGAQVGIYSNLGSNSIADGTTSTFFTEFYIQMTGAKNVNTSIGLTTLDTPSAFGNTFNAQCAIVDTSLTINFGVRNAGATTNVKVLTSNTWYYLWLVVDNAANKYDVYLKNTASDATAADLVANDFAFRTGTADGVIDRFFGMTNYGGTCPDTAVLLDDMTMNTGENLTIPEPASMLILGLGSLFLARRKR